MVQLSHPYMTTGKTITLTIWTFVGKVIYFKYLSRFFITFSFKEQASLNFVATVTIYSDVGDEENKDCHGYHCFPFYLP